MVARGAALLALPLALACKDKGPAIDLSGVDRSDGAIPELNVPRVDSPPAIDGKLDDPSWKSAADTGWLVHPADGKKRVASKVNGKGLWAWDDKALYAAITVYDPDPSTPFERDQVDPHIWSKASGIELMLQPGNRSDNRNYYEIQVDFGGAVWDTRFDDYNRPIRGPKDARIFGHQEWSASLERAVARVDGGYVIELAVPWNAFEGQGISPPAPGDVWKLNLYTFRDGQRDSLAWSPLLGKGNFHRATRFGVLRF